MLRRDVLRSLASFASFAALPGAAGCAASAAGRAGAGAARGATTTPATDRAPRLEYAPIGPLPDAVFVERRRRAVELARAAGASAVVASSGASGFDYLAGADFGRSERLIALLLPVAGAADEPAAIVAPAFEEERVRRKARAARVVPWEEDADPYDLVRRTLGPSARGDVVVEPRADFGVVSALGRAMPEARLVDGSKLFEELRVAKTADELVRMRRAIAITEDAIAAAFDALRVGMTEREAGQLVRHEHQRRGIEGGALVQFGPDAALPHGTPGDRRLAMDEVVLIDGGGTFQGYWSDISRTRWFGGAPPAKFRALYNFVHDAQTAAIARVRPGVAAEAIDRAGRAVIAAGGYGPRFTHRLGHGIGMDGHEATYIVEGNARPLAPGFVFSVEPGIYLPGEMGIRLEDDVACAAEGPDVLSRRAPRVG